MKITIEFPQKTTPKQQAQIDKLIKRLLVYGKRLTTEKTVTKSGWDRICLQAKDRGDEAYRRFLEGCAHEYCITMNCGGCPGRRYASKGNGECVKTLARFLERQFTKGETK